MELNFIIFKTQETLLNSLLLVWFGLVGIGARHPQIRLLPKRFSFLALLEACSTITRLE